MLKDVTNILQTLEWPIFKDSQQEEYLKIAKERWTIISKTKSSFISFRIKKHLKEWSPEVYIQTCKIRPSLLEKKHKEKMKYKESTSQTCKVHLTFSQPKHLKKEVQKSILQRNAKVKLK